MTAKRLNPELTVESYTSKPSWLTITPSSGWSVDVWNVKRFGNVVMAYGVMTRSSAVSANTTYNPFYTNMTFAVLVSDVVHGYVAGSGNVWADFPFSRSANQSIGFSMVGIM